MGRSKKIEEPNYEILLRSAISAYQEDYRELCRLQKHLIDMYWISNDGTLSMMYGVKDLQEKINAYQARILAHDYRVKELKWQLEKQTNTNVTK